MIVLDAEKSVNGCYHVVAATRNPYHIHAGAHLAGAKAVNARLSYRLRRIFVGKTAKFRLTAFRNHGKSMVTNDSPIGSMKMSA